MSSTQTTQPTASTNKFKWVIALVLILAVFLAAGGYYIYQNKSSSSLVLPGVVEVQEVRLASKTGGRVSKVFVADGDYASVGQTLVELEAPELQARQSQLEAQLRAAEAKLLEAKNGPLPEEIEAAKAAVAIAEAKLATLEAGSRDEEIAQAKADVDVHRVTEEHLRTELERMKTLREQRAVSESDYELARSSWQQAVGRQAMAIERLRLLEAGARPENIAEAKAEVRRLKADLALVLRGTREEVIAQYQANVEATRASIEELQANLAEATIKAPADCLVEIVSVRPGDILAPNQPVMRVRMPSDLWVKAFVPETELSLVRVGQEVEITHDGSNQRFKGYVSYISPSSEFTPRNVQSVSERKHQVFGIKVQVKDAQGIFKSGMAAEIYIPRTTKQ